MSGTRMAIVLGIIPIIVGIGYWLIQQAAQATEDIPPALRARHATIDAAGPMMLICFGLALGFGFLVILRGARDL